MYVVFFDIGFVIFLIAMFVLLIVGAAYGIVEFLSNNIGVVIVISLVIAAILFLICWISSKSIIVASTSIIYSSQFCVFVSYGLYLIANMYEEHPIKSILIFLCYALYLLFQLCGLMAVFAFSLDAREYEKGNDRDKKDAIFSSSVLILVLSIVGWIVNWIFLF